MPTRSQHQMVSCLQRPHATTKLVDVELQAADALTAQLHHVGAANWVPNSCLEGCNGLAPEAALHLHGTPCS